MEPNPVTVSPSISVKELVEEFFYKYYFKMFPVVENEKLLGCITSEQIKGTSQKDWNLHTVGELVWKCSSQNTIHPESDALKALSRMSRTGTSRLMVVEEDRLVGIVALKDMLTLLSLKMDLEGYEG
jgi:predicted transcriptional regulator